MFEFVDDIEGITYHMVSAIARECKIWCLLDKYNGSVIGERKDNARLITLGGVLHIIRVR